VKVSLAYKTVCPLAQTLVSELMILANSGLAVWAMERELPLLFRTQNISLPKESNGIWRTPEDIHRVVKVLGSAVLEVKARPHASLAVRAYAPISSPLRRYTDFINLIQTLHFLDQGVPRWSAEQLESLLPTLSARLEAAGCIQRFRPRYWKLVHLKQQGDVAHDAVLVEDAGRFVSASLPGVQIFIRGPRDLFGDKTYPGQPFKVRFSRIDPLNNDIHILDAVEVESE
jgi:exoribonuclease-2